MNKLYRFSPINSKKELIETVDYIASKATELCQKVIGREYPISSLTVFAHYPDEYKRLTEILFKLGELDHENNGPFVKLQQPIKIVNNQLKLLRVRQPDPYRMQVGCNDFEVPD